jgi:hypothetical protein
MRPQAFLVETGDFTQGIVSAATGVAGEVIHQAFSGLARPRDVIPTGLAAMTRALELNPSQASSSRHEAGGILTTMSYSSVSIHHGPGYLLRKDSPIR